MMADHGLARQMPRRYCNTFIYYCCNHDLGVTDTLPSVCASLTQAVVHCISNAVQMPFAHVILNFGILYLWLYYQLVDRELSRNFL